MRQHEHRRVIRRLVAPPALPALVGPWAAHGAEHVAAEDPRADVLEALLGNAVVDAGLPVVVSVHPAPHAHVEEPVHQLGPAHAERILQALIGPGGEAIECQAEAGDAYLAHDQRIGRIRKIRQVLIGENQMEQMYSHGV